MKTPTKVLSVFALIIIAALAYVAFKPAKSGEESIVNRAVEKITRGPEPVPNPVDAAPGIIELSVPFTPQSPLVNWQDAEEDAACEEANMVMAEHWLQNDSAEKLDPNAANTEIHNIINYEIQNYGNAIDTSAADSAKVFNAYYSTGAMTVRYDISKQDIIAELQEGNLVLVPTNGQALGNPHFQQPGPVTHMVTIRGYDSNTNEFITNDPGTKFGENYRYSTDVLYNAIRDYPTGNHLPITDDSKAMLVVAK